MSGRMTPPDEQVDGSGLHVAVVAARFHGEITAALVEGAVACLHEHGTDSVSIDWVPGAFELPLVARARAEAGAVDAVIALGCIVRGETPHFDFVAAEAARGIMDASLETGIPISFGVLTTDTVEQARDRAGGAAGNKGYDAALTALQMAALLAHIDEHAEPGDD